MLRKLFVQPRTNDGVGAGKGIMDKIFRVNMSDLSVKIEEVPSAWAGLGGRALTSTVVAAEVPPTCHPLGPYNKMVFAPGLLSGTAASNSGRCRSAPRAR